MAETNPTIDGLLRLQAENTDLKGEIFHLNEKIEKLQKEQELMVSALNSRTDDAVGYLEETFRLMMNISKRDKQYVISPKALMIIAAFRAVAKAENGVEKEERFKHNPYYDWSEWIYGSRF